MMVTVEARVTHDLVCFSTKQREAWVACCEILESLTETSIKASRVSRSSLVSIYTTRLSRLGTARVSSVGAAEFLLDLAAWSSDCVILAPLFASKRIGLVVLDDEGKHVIGCLLVFSETVSSDLFAIY